MSLLRDIRVIGQQIWLDNLSRSLILEGGLSSLVEQGVAGVTSNPAIFHKAIAGGRYYGDDLAQLKTQALTAEQRYEHLVIPDVQRACDLLRPVFEASDGDAGYVSLEVSPALAHDAAGTCAAARRLRMAVSRDNLLIKIPATAAGVSAIETLTAEGLSINVTLMFSLAHVEQVAEAYLRGLEARAAAKAPLSGIKSVASVFLSRWDTAVDKQLETLNGKAMTLRGKTGVALAKLAYAHWKVVFGSSRFAALERHGARTQTLLWASTGTKNPAYSDLMYVEPLIGPDTVNTLPDATLAALLDHGKVADTLALNIDAAREQFAALAAHGIDLTALSETLQRDGLLQFSEAFAQLLALMTA